MQSNHSPYTPRSKSLDLLRAEAASPVTTRNSLDTISTLRGFRISGPIFLNSSIGVKPLPKEPRLACTPRTNVLDEEGSETFGSSSSSMSFGGCQGEIGPALPNFSSMPGCLTGSTAIQTRTPRRRQVPTDQLKSKFSMSPVQRTKRSKARNSEDRASPRRVHQGFVSQENGRSTLGNWSHSLGMAARKLHRSTLPGKDSEESYATKTLAVQNDFDEKPATVTPDKSKKSLRGARSLASIRKYMTPSRRIRKVSVSRGLMSSSRPRALSTLDDVVIENVLASNGPEEMVCVDADSRKSRADLEKQVQPEVKERAQKSFPRSHPVTRTVAESSSQKTAESPQVERQPVRLRAALPPEFFEPPVQRPTPPPFELPTIQKISNPSSPVTVPNPVIEGQESNETFSAEQVSLSSAQKQQNPAPATSKLKTLQLLARRPFVALGRKMREMEVVWWPPRRSHGAPESAGPVVQSSRDGYAQKDAQTRHSDDVLSTAFPRLSDRSTLAQKSRSVELDRLPLESKVVPLRPTGSTACKRRPTIPAAFVRPPQDSPSRMQQSRSRAQVGHTSQPRISDVRHPWMKQLKLSAAAPLSTEDCRPQAVDSEYRKSRKKVVADESPTAKAFPTLSLTAAGLTLAPPISASFAPVPPKKQSPRRPPASLLGQSLPIPPRHGRSRASTISTQSSAASSPVGKVIVSRRSYGQRLNSPSAREETGSIRSVGTSILFTESPPNSPGLRKLMFPYHGPRTPRVTRVRSPPTTVLLPRFSPRRTSRSFSLQRRSLAVLNSGSDENEEQEWVDESLYEGSATTNNKLITLRSRLEEVIPLPRPGYLETSEATHTLSELIKTFSGSSGSLSLNASPFKKNNISEGVSSPRGLYGIMEADEPNVPSSPLPTHLGTRRVRERLISTASLISTEANSSFEDSEELQRLLESIMAADLGNASSDTSGSRDLALLSPFGSPAEYRDSRTVCERVISHEKRETPNPAPSQASPLPPPPKFLLNDRPISPPDSTCMSEITHSGEADPWNHTSTMYTLGSAATASSAQAHTRTHSQALSSASDYASFSDLDSSHGQ